MKQENYFGYTTIYPTEPQNDIKGATKTLLEMIKKYNVYSVYNALPRIKEVAIKTVNDVGELIDEIK